MSGVWSTPTLEITVPSNVSPAPGSGAIYLGGPSLPQELKNAGYTSALVWFSSGSAYMKYWFMARYGDLSVDNWTFGYCTVAPGPTLGTLVNFDAISAFSFPTNDVQRDLTKIQLLVGKGGYVRLNLSPIIKADYALTGLDGWTTNSSTQTIAGVANCNVKVAWRQTPDYVIDARFFVTVPGGGLPAIPTFSSFNLPGAMPVPDMDVLINQGPHYAGNYTAGAAQGSFNGRYESGKAYVFGLPAGVTFLEGSGTFTQVKP